MPADSWRAAPPFHPLGGASPQCRPSEEWERVVSAGSGPHAHPTLGRGMGASPGLSLCQRNGCPPRPRALTTSAGYPKPLGVPLLGQGGLSGATAGTEVISSLLPLTAQRAAQNDLGTGCLNTWPGRQNQLTRPHSLCPVPPTEVTARCPMLGLTSGAQHTMATA